MKKLALLLVAVASVASAQTSAPAKRGPLAQCRRDNQIAADALETAIAQRDKLQRENEELAKKNEALETEHASLKENFDKVLSVAKDAYALNGEMLTAYKELGEEHGALVARYNNLLLMAQSQAEINATITRNQQMMNALAIYQLMPRYTPPQTINLRITNCVALPALCVN